MSFGDLSRINTNVQALQSLTQLNKTNADIGLRQMRLASGSRINRAEDDSAGYSIAKKLQAKTRGQAQALANIGDAKSMLTVAEGAMGTVMDILQTMKEKTVQAANDSLGTNERTAIKNQLDALTSEVSDVLGGTKFNGQDLFADAGTSFNFQVGDSNGDSFAVAIDGASTDQLGLTGAGFSNSVDVSGVTADISGTAPTVGGTYAGTNGADTFTLTISNYNATGGGSGGVSFDVDVTDSSGAAVGSTQSIDWDGASQTVTVDGATIDLAGGGATGANFADADAIDVAFTDTSIDVSDHTNAQSAIGTIDTAIQNVSDMLGSIGDYQSRLSFKQDNLQTSMTNYEAARSRIEDADFAKEQMEIVKLQILQQTGTASLAQANSAPQSVLSLM